MKTRQQHRRGHTMLELLVASVIGATVLVGSILMFLGGIRLSLGMQTASHALRKSSAGMDRMRQGLEEATAAQLPDDVAPFSPWSATLLGKPAQYTVSQSGQTLNTAVFVSLTRPKSMVFRTSASKVQTLTLSSRQVPNRGILLYRGDALGQPAPSTGRFLWQWLYENGAVTDKIILYRKLSPFWNAVAFRRGSVSGQVLRYRLLLVETNLDQKQSSAFGQDVGGELNASDYAVSLMNYSGDVVPETALPASVGLHP